MNWLIIDRPDYLIDVIQFLQTKIDDMNDDDFGNIGLILMCHQSDRARPRDTSLHLMELAF